ncbi:DUF3883 domain-containing protein [Sulfurimonas sp. HSL3-7]|uniref:DUF3883 domain-containing protein n=1 Tax=Sulfonitrofixus jiaomeiensis TaxID=3131938 RepID=UPI0031F96C48
MIEKLLDQDRLGTKSQILYIIGLLSNGAASYEDLRHACSSQEYSFSTSFKGAIVLLEYLGIIKRNGVLSVVKLFDSDDFAKDFTTLLFSRLSQDKELHNFINNNNFVYDQNSELIFIMNNLIRLEFSSLRNLLMSLGVFFRDDLIENHLVLHKDFIEWFFEVAIPLIEQSKIRNCSLINLENLQKKQKIIGIEAEEFVLEFEKVQRKEHPKQENIKIISEVDTSAGYDILSYQTDTSIFLDKYIEVKSYDGKESFYWSKNEMEVAKIKKDDYYLYLVNRSEMNKEGYKPIMIQNPFDQVLNNDKWDKTVEKYFISI